MTRNQKVMQELRKELLRRAHAAPHIWNERLRCVRCDTTTLQAMIDNGHEQGVGPCPVAEKANADKFQWPMAEGVK